MANNGPRSADEVLRAAYDEETNTLNTNTSAVTIENVSLNVNLDAAGGDSVKISDGTDTMLVNADGSINVSIAAGNLAVELAASDGDNVAISDGTDTLAVNTDGSINTVDVIYATRVDEASATVTYVGKAAVASSNASAVWQISRITVSGTVTTIEYADGDVLFNNIWDNRAALSYS